MKKSRFLLLCCLVAFAALPARVFADAFCADPPPYQYQSCGVVADTNTFTVNSDGLISGINMRFGTYHADFSSSINALVWRGDQLVYTGPNTALNTDMHTYQYFRLVPNSVLQAGDQIEFVLHVNDPNGNQDYYSSELGKNIDGLNHVWAEPLTNGLCVIVAGPCTYLGFEDVPQQEGSDFDYNDFRAWIFGMSISNGSENAANPVPEPSPIFLIAGAPLAFAVRKLRSLL
jgi:hypothetical protein